MPVRIKIPAINIDAPIDQVGLAPDGTMDVPSGPANAAWFNLGPHPGEIGSAVIDGHAGWKNGTPAVFDYLYKLHIGDKIYIEDEKGITTTFVVRKKETYKEGQDASAVFGSDDEGAHLNLITCSGVWNKIEKNHSDRLVVFADKEI